MQRTLVLRDRSELLTSMDPVNSRPAFRTDYSFAEYRRSRDDSPGAPTVYMPSPISGTVDPQKYSPASRMLADVSSVGSKLQRGNQISADKPCQDKSASTWCLLHFWLVHASRSIGIMAGVLTCVVGMSRLYQQSVTLRWPESGSFFSDTTNSNSWRQPLFTLQPETLCDVWTPFFFGLVSMVAQLRWLELCSMPKTFWYSSVCNVVQALWANLGYCGGLGIVAGGVSLAAAFINILAACLTLHAKVTLSMSSSRIERLPPLPSSSGLSASSTIVSGQPNRNTGAKAAYEELPL